MRRANLRQQDVADLLADWRAGRWPVAVSRAGRWIEFPHLAICHKFVSADGLAAYRKWLREGSGMWPTPTCHGASFMHSVLWLSSTMTYYVGPDTNGHSLAIGDAIALNELNAKAPLILGGPADDFD